MYSINVSENIARLRRERKITQEQLAEFVGVTKASVSKWETGQSIPDVLMLPQLATFFDVTVDELIGYKPQLSEEQIIKIYRDLCVAYVQEPFEEVMEKSKKLVHQYYSCYSFLYRICLLWANHFMLAKEQERQQEILADASELCERIISNAKDIALCNDVVDINATINLLRGDAKAVIDTLEGLQNPSRICNQSVGILIKAYEMENEMEKADSYTQISMYSQLITLIGCATEYLAIHSDDLAVCQETIKRIEKVEEAYNADWLNFNAMCLFYYQAAIVCCMHGEKQQSFEMLGKYVKCMEIGFSEEEIRIHGDDYFNNLESWFEKLEVIGGAPREKSIILDSAIGALEHPALACLQEEEGLKKLRQKLQRLGK